MQVKDVVEESVRSGGRSTKLDRARASSGHLRKAPETGVRLDAQSVVITDEERTCTC